VIVIDDATSLLFVPGDRSDRVRKAFGTSADLICIDLEDSVAPERKTDARNDTLTALRDAPAHCGVRINRVASREGLLDLIAIADAPPPFVLIPMTEHPAELRVTRSVIGNGVPLIPLIESVGGMATSPEIARAEGVVAMMFGGGDLAAELGVELGWEPLAFARAQFVMACAAAKVRAIDVPFVRLDDPTGLADECGQARRLGFHAKAAIHPAQLDAIHAAFSPSEQERAEAREALAAWRAGGGSAIRWKGRMLEAPLVKRLERVAGEAGHA
jgi:citrate lyase subunit beta/citryl-CoA lyase/(S)-citramalyl-CoA lyase